jgi:hypothetical protein
VFVVAYAFLIGLFHTLFNTTVENFAVQIERRGFDHRWA